MTWPAHRVSPCQMGDRHAVLSVLSAEPCAREEILARLARRSQEITRLGHRLSELCVLGYARRDEGSYALTARGETFLEDLWCPSPLTKECRSGLSCRSLQTPT
ncbi:hypothetical protein [Deinococcus marmoris]|uniref:hypothetical protein n=1 Tax=Deinococcus marmoris TaxID=249408 RepID=UPI00096A86D2|nr:hypothetical protein [Deinococcus marmoris]